MAPRLPEIYLGYQILVAGTPTSLPKNLRFSLKFVRKFPYWVLGLALGLADFCTKGKCDPTKQKFLNHTLSFVKSYSCTLRTIGCFAICISALRTGLWENVIQRRSTWKFRVNTWEKWKALQMHGYYSLATMHLNGYFLFFSRSTYGS